ncbi:hypothetical protein A3F66_06620 [candidate division TM6 bacterium RIFCSPHIGHO2_12_FULL_32_22]|nr:MAG: hypothetical protein A3F66_06620 [candidate division TM6 bacterium RIFCSPHIGHO2_12_FULL_32_22]
MKIYKYLLPLIFCNSVASADFSQLPDELQTEILKPFLPQLVEFIKDEFWSERHIFFEILDCLTVEQFLYLQEYRKFIGFFKYNVIETDPILAKTARYSFSKSFSWSRYFEYDCDISESKQNQLKLLYRREIKKRMIYLLGSKLRNSFPEMAIKKLDEHLEEDIK